MNGSNYVGKLADKGSSVTPGRGRGSYTGTPFLGEQYFTSKMSQRYNSIFYVFIQKLSPVCILAGLITSTNLGEIGAVFLPKRDVIF